MNDPAKRLTVFALQACLLTQSLQAEEPQAASVHLSSRKAMLSAVQSGVHFHLGDTVFPDWSSDASRPGPGEAAELVFAAEDTYAFPQHVSHAPGYPAKPIRKSPGDIDRSDCPAARYTQDDNARSGWPQTLRKWTSPTITPHYSAGYVGGGSAWISPGKRGRSIQEGTWGLDYSTWKCPGTVWMLWTHGRTQGQLGAYRTDR